MQLGSSQLSAHHSSVRRPAFWPLTCFLEPWSLSLTSPHFPQGEQTPAACLFIWDLPICHLTHSRHSWSVWPRWPEPLHRQVWSCMATWRLGPNAGCALVGWGAGWEARVGADLGPSTPSKEFISPPASHFKPQGPKGPGRVWSLRLQFVLSTQPFCPSHHTDTHTDVHIPIYTQRCIYIHTHTQIHTY